MKVNKDKIDLIIRKCKKYIKAPTKYLDCYESARNIALEISIDGDCIFTIIYAAVLRRCTYKEIYKILSILKFPVIDMEDIINE